MEEEEAGQSSKVVSGQLILRSELDGANRHHKG